MEITLQHVPDKACPCLYFVLDTLCSWFGWRWLKALEIAGLSADVTNFDATASSQAMAAALEPAAGLQTEDGYYRIVLQYFPEDFAKAPSAPQLPTFFLLANGLLNSGATFFSKTQAWGQYQGWECPCGTDPMAGMFYLLAACGEYPDFAEQADQRRMEQLQIRPLADRLAEAFASELLKTLGLDVKPVFVPEGQPSSFDIDAPRALLGKRLYRQGSTLLRAMLQDTRQWSSNLEAASPRLLHAYRSGKDPFDAFGQMRSINEELGLRPRAFSLCGYATRIDPGWPFGDKRWIKLWRELDEWCDLGLHPSYHSSEQPELLEREYAWMSEALGRPVTISRQHFLRFSLPDTFRQLEALGVKEDHSFGWSEVQGFRLGTARSVRWYDLKADSMSALRLVPPHAMDITARRLVGRKYLREPVLAKAQILAQWEAMAGEAMRSGAQLRIIWHNSSMSPVDGWQSDLDFYRKSLQISLFGKTR